MKLNKKKLAKQLDYIQNEFGQIDKIVELSYKKFKFYYITILPTEETPYNIVCTLGLSQIRPKVAPKNVVGLEFFMVLPKEWSYSSDDNDRYDDGWVRYVIEEVACLLLNNKVIIPGSTIGFQHLKNGSQHTSILVGFSNKFAGVYEEKGKNVIYFELQSLLPNELERVIAEDEELVNRIMDLPCVDMNRESLV